MESSLSLTPEEIVIYRPDEMSNRQWDKFTDALEEWLDNYE